MRNLKYAAIVAGLISLYAPSAQANPGASECEPPQVWVQRIQTENANIPTDRIETMPDHIIPALVKHYNEIPPVEKQIEADMAIIIVGKGNEQVSPALIGLFLKGCVVGSFPLTVPAQRESGA